MSTIIHFVDSKLPYAANSIWFWRVNRILKSHEECMAKECMSLETFTQNFEEERHNWFLCYFQMHRATALLVAATTTENGREFRQTSRHLPGPCDSDLKLQLLACYAGGHNIDAFSFLCLGSAITPAWHQCRKLRAFELCGLETKSRLPDLPKVLARLTRTKQRQMSYMDAELALAALFASPSIRTGHRSESAIDPSRKSIRVGYRSESVIDMRAIRTGHSRHRSESA